jgi:nicotinamide-nucleotide amidase
MYSRVFKFCGISRDLLEKRIGDIIKLPVTLTEVGEEIYLRLVTSKREEAMDAEDELTGELGEYIFGTNEETLEKVVAELLTKNELKIAVAESLTGGSLSDRLTNVPGSSAYFLAGIVAYSNEAKHRLLNVSPKTILQYGAVSSFVAAEMATGARQILDADIGIGITGIAGPGGGTPEKPVGLVFVALSSVFSNPAERFLFQGTRSEIKMRATQRALNSLRLFLVEEYESEEGEPG